MDHITRASVKAPASAGPSRGGGARRWLTWQRYLVFGVVAVLLRVAIPDERSAQAFSVAIQLFGVLVVWIGVTRIPFADRRPALLFAIGLTLYAVGDVFYYF